MNSREGTEQDAGEGALGILTLTRIKPIVCPSNTARQQKSRNSGAEVVGGKFVVTSWRSRTRIWLWQILAEEPGGTNKDHPGIVLTGTKDERTTRRVNANGKLRRDVNAPRSSERVASNTLVPGVPGG